MKPTTLTTHITTTATLVAVLAGSARADEPAAPASDAAPAAPTAASAPPRAIVLHVAPASTPAGEPVELEAMIDAPFAENLVARWRAIGDADWQEATFERSSAGAWFATLPTARPPGVEYYIRGADAAGTEVAHFASSDRPHIVRVDPTLYDRLEELDRERLGGHANQVSLEVVGHNFGNRYDIPDRYLRGEVTYTHRLLRHLHHIAFGFGTIEGKTPDSVDARMPVEYDRNALRYGFGEVRLRAHPSVFLDLRVALGVSQDGFDQAARGQITFGKPWRSSVTVGGEVIGDLGPTAWVRLQWDTAPPLLMGASIVRTDLPGALVDRSGLFVGYDVAYKVAQRFTVKAQLSYGARDGAANVGGGLGTAVDF